MTRKQVLFSFKGRINRATYWVYILALIFLLIIAVVCLGILDVVFGIPDSDLLAAVPVIPTVILICYVNLALHVKRFHDTNRSGWNYLWGFIPFFGECYILGVCGCTKGTGLENKYGPLPAKGITGFRNMQSK